MGIMQVKPSKHLSFQEEAVNPSKATQDQQRLYMSLLLVMQEKGLIGVCSWMHSSRSAPRLIALVPQEAQYDEHDIQVRVSLKAY
jgi:hypothetical protein